MEPHEVDPYATLGVDRNCTDEQIRVAYRLLAKKYHPDLQGESSASVALSQQLNAAYEVLGDPARRRAYDREAAPGKDATVPRPRIQRDISHEVGLPIEDFLRGTSLEIRVNDPANADGVETYLLTIPPETAPGTRLRVPRSGPFAGGTVRVKLRIRPGGRFKVRGSDLCCELRISSQRARQGGTETIRGPLGSAVRVEIPPAIARGAVLRRIGEGLPRPRGGRGDMLVRITYRVEVRVGRNLR